jgi:NAD-dependent dihydropyrimidine dehydrogenase PreA subunit
MSREEIIEKIASSGLKEYGVYQTSVANSWKEQLSREDYKEESLRLSVSLNNADTSGVLLELLRQNPQEIFEGMCITSYVLGAQEMILYLPEKEKELANELEGLAAEHKISVKAEMLPIRECEEKQMHHIVTMKQVHDIIHGCYEDKIYISLNGKDLEAFAPTTKLSKLVTEENIKAIEAGYGFYTSSFLEKTLSEVQILNGVINVITDKNCIIKETMARTEEFRSQSCGQCVFCREGLIQLHGMLKDITDGKGKNEYPDLLKEIGSAMTYSTSCSLGQEAAKGTLSTLEYFGGEYEEHIRKKNCSANVCSSFQMIYIDPHACEGCEACLDVCPVNCIEGKKGFIHMIDEFECTKCGKCIEACEYDAIIQTTGKLPKLPERLMKCGKFKKH